MRNTKTTTQQQTGKGNDQHTNGKCSTHDLAMLHNFPSKNKGGKGTSAGNPKPHLDHRSITAKKLVPRTNDHGYHPTTAFLPGSCLRGWTRRASPRVAVSGLARRNPSSSPRKSALFRRCCGPDNSTISHERSHEITWNILVYITANISRNIVLYHTNLDKTYHITRTIIVNISHELPVSQ